MSSWTTNTPIIKPQRKKTKNTYDNDGFSFQNIMSFVMMQQKQEKDRHVHEFEMRQ